LTVGERDAFHSFFCAAPNGRLKARQLALVRIRLALAGGVNSAAVHRLLPTLSLSDADALSPRSSESCRFPPSSKGDEFEARQMQAHPSKVTAMRVQPESLFAHPPPLPLKQAPSLLADILSQLARGDAMFYLLHLFLTTIFVSRLIMLGPSLCFLQSSRQPNTGGGCFLKSQVYPTPNTCARRRAVTDQRYRFPSIAQSLKACYLSLRACIVYVFSTKCSPTNAPRYVGRRAEPRLPTKTSATPRLVRQLEPLGDECTSPAPHQHLIDTSILEDA
jgi:hypothetical protein